jgi:hypothetical protein
MTQKYEEFLLEHRIYKDGVFNGHGSVIAKRLQHILAVKEQMGIDSNYMIRGWDAKNQKWDTLVDKGLIMVELRVKSLDFVREERELELAM